MTLRQRACILPATSCLRHPSAFLDPGSPASHFPGESASDLHGTSATAPGPWLRSRTRSREPACGGSHSESAPEYRTNPVASAAELRQPPRIDLEMERILQYARERVGGMSPGLPHARGSDCARWRSARGVARTRTRCAGLRGAVPEPRRNPEAPPAPCRSVSPVRRPAGTRAGAVPHRGVPPAARRARLHLCAIVRAGRREGLRNPERLRRPGARLFPVPRSAGMTTGPPPQRGIPSGAPRAAWRTATSCPYAAGRACALPRVLGAHSGGAATPRQRSRRNFSPRGTCSPWVREHGGEAVTR